MKILTVTRSTMLALLCLFTSAHVLSTEYDINNKAQVEAFVDGALGTMLKATHSQSAVVVIKKDGEVILSKGYGYADIENDIAIDPKTSLFRPGSISKLYTWLSVMQLVEQGKLDLDKDVNEYLKLIHIDDTYPGQPVTMRHIMTHTAGFEDGSLGYLIIQKEENILPLAEALAKYQPKRVYAPGEYMSYSNWGTALAGVVVANISGEPFETYIENHFFKPMGMKYATFREPLPESLVQFEAKPYVYQNGAYVRQPFEFISNFTPAGASSMAGEEMAKFGQMIVNGGSFNGHQIIKPETIQYMLNNGFGKDDRILDMGLGFVKMTNGPAEMGDFGHNGATTLFFSHLGLSQKENFVIFFSQTGDPQLQGFIPLFYDTFFPEQIDLPAPPENFSDYAAKYTGNYISTRSNYSKIDSLARMFSGGSVELTDDNMLLVRGERFVEIGKNLFRHISKDQRIAFLENEQGEITGAIYDGVPAELVKAKWWETTGINLPIVALCALMCLLVLLRAPIQWSFQVANGSKAKRVYVISLVTCASHLLFILFYGVSLLDQKALMYEITMPMKIALTFAICSVPLTILHLYMTVQSWRGAGIVGTWSKCKHSMISIISLLMLGFYWAWNMIGYNYF